MSAFHAFSAFGGIRQFWVLPKDDLGPVASNQENDKGPLQRSPSFVWQRGQDCLWERLPPNSNSCFVSSTGQRHAHSNVNPASPSLFAGAPECRNN